MLFRGNSIEAQIPRTRLSFIECKRSVRPVNRVPIEVLSGSKLCSVTSKLED